MLHAPHLPQPRGPLSARLFESLRARPGAQRARLRPSGEQLDEDDLQLALYACYELHYRGWAGVDAAWEHDPDLVRLRRGLECAFMASVRDAVHDRLPRAPIDAVSALREMVADAGGPSVSSYMVDDGTLPQLRELAVHRSAYQLKEADPHTWAIPRLPAGRAKSALLRLQYDEYGNGLEGQSHAELFADTMRALDLDPSYGAYLDEIPAITLATVNLLSMFGLHREHVGACLGHLAVFEMTSVLPMSRYAAAMRRLTGADDGIAFYDVHVRADAVHQVVAIDELIPGLLDADPALAADVLFGAAALLHVEQRLATHLLERWAAGRTSLRLALPPTALFLAS
jgi:hypothetical protein